MKNKSKRNPSTRKILATSLALLLIAGLTAAGLWLTNPQQAMAEVDLSLVSDSVIEVSQDPWLVFAPRTVQTETGLVLYPGGRVVAEAYSPTARSIAEAGYLVIIVPMPLNLAVLAPNSAMDVMDEYSTINNWVIGGHSLGGAMAARFAHDFPQRVKGLVMWASFPAQSDNLSELPLAVASIYATEDGLATEEEVIASASRLPAETRFVAIDGGNHAQFGWYGEQSGDGQAVISRARQQQIIIEATTQLLRQISR